MQLDLTFWTVAWCLMGITFITATCAILLGAKGLDKASGIEDDETH